MELSIPTELSLLTRNGDQSPAYQRFGSSHRFSLLGAQHAERIPESVADAKGKIIREVQWSRGKNDWL